MLVMNAGVSSMLYQSNVLCIKQFDHSTTMRTGKHGAFVYWLPCLRMVILVVIIVSIVIAIMVFVII